jgi:hypothetical protein
MDQNNTDCTLRIPSNLHPDAFVCKYAVKRDKKQNLIDGIYFFMSCIIDQLETSKGYNLLITSGFVQISRRFLCKVLISETRVSEVLNILKKENIIVCDGAFKIGKRSNGYRLHKSYLGTGYTNVTLNSSSMKKKLLDLMKERQDRSAKKQYTHLTKFLDSPSLTFDLEGFHNFLEVYSKKIKDRIQELTEVNEEAKKEYSQRLELSTAIQKNKAKNFSTAKMRYKTDETGNRLHSQLTNMKKHSRYFLRYEGQHLVSIDLKASQPYLLTIPMKQDFWKSNRKGKIRAKTIYPELYNNINKFNKVRPNLSTTSLKSLIHKGFQNDGFSKIDWERDFYIQFMEYVRANFADNKRVLKSFETREKTKKNIMLLLFDTEVKKYASLILPFKKQNPALYRMMDQLKNMTVDGTNNNLPILLQRIEAFLMLETITKEIATDHPQIPLFTIHDSILTTAEHADVVRKYLCRILEQHTGLKPGYHIEGLSVADLVSQFNDIVESDFQDIANTKRPNLSTIFSEEYLSKIKDEAYNPLLKIMPEFCNEVILSTRYLD